MKNLKELCKEASQYWNKCVQPKIDNCKDLKEFEDLQSELYKESGYCDSALWPGSMAIKMILAKNKFIFERHLDES